MTEVELDFMGRLLVMDPGQRMTARECLQHPYLLDLHLADTARASYTSGLSSSRSDHTGDLSSMMLQTDRVRSSEGGSTLAPSELAQISRVSGTSQQQQQPPPYSKMSEASGTMQMGSVVGSEVAAETTWAMEQGEIAAAAADPSYAM